MRRLTQAASAAYLPDGRWATGAVPEFGDDLFHDRMVAVELIGLDRGERGIGDERVVPVGGEQFPLLTAIGGERLDPFDPAHDQPAGHVLVLASAG